MSYLVDDAHPMVGLADVNAGPQPAFLYRAHSNSLVGERCMPGTVRHPTDTSVTSDLCAHLNQRPGAPLRAGRTFPVSDNHRKATSATPDPPGHRQSYGGRLDHGVSQRLGDRDPGRTVHPLHAVGVSAWRTPRIRSRCGDRVVAELGVLPPALRLTLTWDQGKEMARHREIAHALGTTEIYFCEPHSPWQRPSNENTNGLVRAYFPKGTKPSRARRPSHRRGTGTAERPTAASPELGQPN